jgi:hypothetical protein
MERSERSPVAGPWRAAIATALLAISGCSAASLGRSGDGLDLPEPDAAFMKRVERDPFPRAEQAQIKR